MGVIKVLLDAGANVDAKDVQEYTSLHEASIRGHENMVALLLRAGAHINARIYRGNTALHLASWKGYKNIVRLLLEEGARMNMKDNPGKTASDVAKNKSIKKMIDSWPQERNKRRLAAIMSLRAAQHGILNNNVIGAILPKTHLMPQKTHDLQTISKL